MFPRADRTTAAQILDALDRWVAQRPGLDYADYGNPTAYRAESRRITRQRHDYDALRLAIARGQHHEHLRLTERQLLNAFDAFSGRLTPTIAEDGMVTLDYTTGQHWPTEYRAAACAVLARALWTRHRESLPPDHPEPGTALRKVLRLTYGARIQREWFA